jgi:hypothetical protein
MEAAEEVVEFVVVGGSIERVEELKRYGIGVIWSVTVVPEMVVVIVTSVY